MRFLFQGSPAKQKMETDVSFTVLGTPHFQPDLDITDCLCAIWTISLACRAALCVPVARLVSASHSLEPAPVAALAKLRGVGLPETLSRSAPHSSHTTLYYWANLPKYNHCKSLLLLFGRLKNKENTNCKFIGLEVCVTLR